MPFMKKFKVMNITFASRSKAMVFTRERVKSDSLFSDGAKPNDVLWFVKTTCMAVK